MPEFELVSRQEAMTTSSMPSRSQVIQEYAQREDHAVRGRDGGNGTPPIGFGGEGIWESIQIRRVGPDIYFWEEPAKRRGGRPRKNAAA